MIAREPAPFDPTVAIGEGITVLEASAGTGKTHAVASLVLVEVAERRRLDELLVVTFTRKATGTLRERVWRRLSDGVDALQPDAPDSDDPVLKYLRRGSPDEVAERRRKLQRALSDFDAATITTTHGFCQHVLASLGVAADAERDLEIVENVVQLVDEAVDDLFVRRFHAKTDLLFDRPTALSIAKAVVGNPDCAIGPVDNNEADLLRRKFAVSLRDRITQQKRLGRIITYDDLLTRLASSIDDEDTGELVAERLRRRYTMAIVDEFQDTDSVQSRILQRAFGAAPSRLVLVGDPKQAIYAFRGGDVTAYLEATSHVQHRCSLPISWRADQPLLDAQDALFDGAQLGHPTILHRPVFARPGASGSALSGPAAGDALTVRIARCSSGHFDVTKRGVAVKNSVREFIVEDLAAEAVCILRSATLINGQAVVPGDLAVLTRTNREAQMARDCLQAVGVPAVVHGGSSVFSAAAARDWLDLLRALEQPSSVTRVHAVAFGAFFGWSATRIGTATDTEWEFVDGALHEWAVDLRDHQVTGLLRRIDATTGFTARLLGTVDGERRLSDLRHIAELLQGWQSAHPASVAVLAAWLAEQIQLAEDGGSEDARRRLETDADAVAIHTIHGAKGLEFPIVLLPSAWDGPYTDENAPPVFHDDDGNRTIGVGGNGPCHDEQAERAAIERDEEELRLLYVSITRAKHKVVMWWATASDAKKVALARLLCGREGEAGAVQRTVRGKVDDDAIAAELASRSITFEEAHGSTGERYLQAPAEPTLLDVARFDRGFDLQWVRTSYSGLTHGVHDGVATSALGSIEPDEQTKADETDVSTAAADLSEPVPLGGIPGGARVGTLVHDILERTDFAAADLRAELSAACVATGAHRILEGHVDALVSGLALAIDSPLGPAWGGGSLRTLRRADRLNELDFELPLAGGDNPAGSLVTMNAIAAVFARLPADDPLSGYAERLRDPRLATSVRGFLNGSIDLVARLGDRHIVVDYKTNLLVASGQVPMTSHYRRAALIDAMQDAHYPLQAALYSVALHRFLRWRIADYDPARHLGGVAYLFLRGMTGLTAPIIDGDPCGVFTWTPPASFVLELSDLLDRGLQ